MKKVKLYFKGVWRALTGRAYRQYPKDVYEGYTGNPCATPVLGRI